MANAMTSATQASSLFFTIIPSGSDIAFPMAPIFAFPMAAILQ
jgi:hypothetical protein